MEKCWKVVVRESYSGGLAQVSGRGNREKTDLRATGEI